MVVARVAAELPSSSAVCFNSISYGFTRVQVAVSKPQLPLMKLSGSVSSSCKAPCIAGRDALALYTQAASFSMQIRYKHKWHNYSSCYHVRDYGV
jgi:hypothetical protein